MAAHAERTAALATIERRADRPRRITLGADKGYAAHDLVNEQPSMKVAPHIARYNGQAAFRRRLGSGLNQHQNATTAARATAEA